MGPRTSASFTAEGDDREKTIDKHRRVDPKAASFCAQSNDYGCIRMYLQNRIASTLESCVGARLVTTVPSPLTCARMELLAGRCDERIALSRVAVYGTLLSIEKKCTIVTAAWGCLLCQLSVSTLVNVNSSTHASSTLPCKSAWFFDSDVGI